MTRNICLQNGGGMRMVLDVSRQAASHGMATERYQLVIRDRELAAIIQGKRRGVPAQ